MLKISDKWSVGLYELLFSIYVAGNVVNREALREGSSKFIALLAVPLFFIDRVDSNWRDRPLLFPRGHAELASLPLNLGLIVFLAVIVLLGLRVIGQISFIQGWRDYMLISVIVAGPLIAPILEGSYIGANGNHGLSDIGHLRVSALVQSVEMALVLGLVCLGRFQNWPKVLHVLLLSAHFGFWALIICGGNCGKTIEGTFLYLLVPFAASLMWAALSTERDRSAATT